MALGVQAETSSFTPPSAETFTGKRAAVDLLQRLQIDILAARDPLERVGLSTNDLVTHWQWSAPHDTAPPSVELQFENDARAVVAVPGGALLAYVRYGSYWVAPGPPEKFAPEKPETKDDALPEADAATKIDGWLAKFLPPGTWRSDPLEYKDRYDATPADLYGAWWETRAERIHLGYPVRGVDVHIAINATTGDLMQLQVPLFEGPREAAVYFPIENARIKAQDYLAARPAESLGELVLRDPAAPEQFLDALDSDFAVRGGLGNAKPGSRAERKRARKAEEKAIEEGSTGPQPLAIPPTLAPGDVPLVLAPVSLVYAQAQWKPLSDSTPTSHQFLLVYAFPTQTPTARTAPVYVTAAGNEVVR